MEEHFFSYDIYVFWRKGKYIEGAKERHMYIEGAKERHTWLLQNAHKSLRKAHYNHAKKLQASP